MMYNILERSLFDINWFDLYDQYIGTFEVKIKHVLLFSLLLLLIFL